MCVFYLLLKFQLVDHTTVIMIITLIIYFLNKSRMTICQTLFISSISSFSCVCVCIVVFISWCNKRNLLKYEQINQFTLLDNLNNTWKLSIVILYYHTIQRTRELSWNENGEIEFVVFPLLLLIFLLLKKKIEKNIEFIILYGKKKLTTKSRRD